MRKKGFTLVELLVCIVIVAALAGLVLGGARSCSGEHDPYMFETVEQRRNRIEQEKVEAMREQNDLLRRQIEQNEKPER